MKVILSKILSTFFPAGMMVCCFMAVSVFTARQPDTSVAIRFETDEADAILSILKKRAAHRTLTEDDWDRLFSSEGYLRLKKREESFRVGFTNVVRRRHGITPKAPGDVQLDSAVAEDCSMTV